MAGKCSRCRSFETAVVSCQRPTEISCHKPLNERYHSLDLTLAKSKTWMLNFSTNWRQPRSLLLHLPLWRDCETAQVQERAVAARSVYGESTALQRILSWSAARCERVHGERGWLVTVGNPMLTAVQQAQPSCYSSCDLFTSNTPTHSLQCDIECLCACMLFEVCPMGGGPHEFPENSLTQYTCNGCQITRHLHNQLWQLFGSRLT